MNIGIIGSGMVGQNLGSVLARGGHEVVLGTRTPEALDERRSHGATSLREWLEHAGPRARVGTFAQAAAHGEVVLNATSGDGALPALALAGDDNLAGKILMDISNPLDFSQGAPPTLFVCNDDSLGERIQRAHPAVQVVKTLNTTTTFVMGDPGQLAGGDHTIFMSGNDSQAKERVAAFLRDWFGWRDIIDLGDITTARGAEMLLPLWVRLYAALGTALFNFKVVR